MYPSGAIQVTDKQESYYPNYSKIYWGPRNCESCDYDGETRSWCDECSDNDYKHWELSEKIKKELNNV